MAVNNKPTLVVVIVMRRSTVPAPVELVASLGRSSLLHTHQIQVINQAKQFGAAAASGGPAIDLDQRATLHWYSKPRDSSCREQFGSLLGCVCQDREKVASSGTVSAAYNRRRRLGDDSGMDM